MHAAQRWLSGAAVFLLPALVHAQATAAGADQSFVEKAGAGGLSEVKLGKLATEKGTSAAVKALAAKKKLQVPPNVSSEQAATYEKLTKLSGAAFDKAYIDAMVKDHDEDVEHFRKAAAAPGMDPDLKAWARKTLAVIEQHDHLAHQDKDLVKK
jgi:putative membrane protein